IKMKSKLIIVKGKKSKQYALDKTRNKKTLVILSDLGESNKFKTINNNVQVGKSTEETTLDYLLKHEKVIISPYNVEDLVAFLNADILEDFLKTEDREMYIIMKDKKI